MGLNLYYDNTKVVRNQQLTLVDIQDQNVYQLNEEFLFSVHHSYFKRNEENLENRYIRLKYNLNHTFGKIGSIYLGLDTLGNVTFQLRILFCIGKQSRTAEHNSVSVNLVFLTIEYADFLIFKEFKFSS